VPSAPVTRGRLTALWLVLRSLDKLGGRGEVPELMAYARRSSLRGGGLPLNDGLRLAREGGFVMERAGTVDLEALGAEALSLETEDEPGTPVLRLFVSVLLLRDPPTWVAYWQGDPGSVDQIIPPSERRLMSECGLLPAPLVDDLAAWSMWEALSRVPLPEQSDVRRRLIGDAGEQLTLDHERMRLSEEGFPDLARGVKWVAQESPAYGFDVLSYAGRSELGEPDLPIAIEVKSTTLPERSVFQFFLTIHEWQTAQKLGDRYRLHFWSSVDPGPPPASRYGRPRVMPADQLRDHLPVQPDCGDDCGWQSARVLMPLAT